MEIDALLPPIELKEIPAVARAAESMGFGCLWSTETKHDPFLPGVLVAEHTSRIKFGTGIAVAFARSPGNLAYLAWDLAEASGGRFILGLGTQVKAHIERRFGVAWPESVVGKLREQIQALHAFWDSWQNGSPLNLRGEYYKLTLMTPFFNPGPIEHPDIPIYLAGVNTGLARLAGEIAQGFMVHPFHTSRYLEKILLPAIAAGAAVSGRNRKEITVQTTVFAATSPAEVDFVRQQISFYASTPSYRPVMALHGWERTAETLSQLAARGRWEEMPGEIHDEMLETFAVICPQEGLGQALAARYAGLVDRLGLYIPFVPGERDGFWKSLNGQA